MAINPQFAATPKVGVAAISTANTNRDGTGTIGTVFTAGSNGSRIEYVVIKAIVTTTAGTVRLFVHDGSTNHLIDEIIVTAITASATVAAFMGYWTPPGSFLVLPNGYSLRAATNNAEAFNIIAVGGDY